MKIKIALPVKYVDDDFRFYRLETIELPDNLEICPGDFTPSELEDIQAMPPCLRADRIVTYKVRLES